jgi:hypothetical protein
MTPTQNAARTEINQKIKRLSPVSPVTCVTVQEEERRIRKAAEVEVVEIIKQKMLNNRATWLSGLATTQNFQTKSCNFKPDIH